MKKFLLITGVAAMALAAPASAQKDDKGDKGKPHAAKVAKQDKGQNRGNGQARQGKPDKAMKQQARARDRQQDRVQRAVFDRRDDDRRDRDRDWDRRDRDGDRNWADARDRDRDRDRDWDDDRWDRDGDFAYFRGDCPPGLAKKNNGCLPPGQAKKIYDRGDRFDSDMYRRYNLPLAYRDTYYDTPNYYYRYDDSGYIYRVNRENDMVSALIPLLGGGFGVGQMMPAGYGVYNVPIQYRDTYYDTPDAYYRYGDNAIYRVDPQSGMIESIVALLAGGDMGIGSVLPAGYSTYNVPLGYRDQYYDTPESMYRYANGNIYQVDPQTQIIQAIIEALV